MTAPAAPGEILFLCHRMPWPPDRGDKIRSYHELRALAEIASVHVACFADDARDEVYGEAMAAVTASQCVVRRHQGKFAGALRGLALGTPVSVALFSSTTLQRYVGGLLKDRPIRAVFAFSGQMAQFVPTLPPGIRFVMDMVDVDSAKFAAYGATQGGPMGWVNRREGRVLAAYERAIAARADVTLFVSEAEAGLFRQTSGLGADRVRAQENGVALDHFSPSAQFAPLAAGDGPLLVFTGQMDYAPNVEAVESFARLALPAIRAVHPQARFAIVGRGPSAAVRALAALPGVEVTGEVPDPRPWVAAADVVVAPLRIARGIQNKVLEAMAMARPVVASAAAAEGIDAAAGTELLVAERPEDEAALVLELLADPARAAAMGAAARARVEARYSWDARLAPLRALLACPGKAR